VDAQEEPMPEASRVTEARRVTEASRTPGYDVVVVGAGSAGCVLAARLAATGATVLLLEAGPDLRAAPSAEMRDGWQLPTIPDWGYRTEPDAAGATKALRRGKLVGGTSHLTRFATRGAPGDYDAWASLGNPGWSWEAVLPLFRRLEHDLEFGADAWHGNAGPLPVTRYPELELAPVHAEAREALEAAGFDAVDDHNRPGAMGVGPMPMSSRAGIRTTTADAYLPADRPPARLTLRPESEVASILIERGRAIGVRLLDGTLVHGDRVVLAAGAYGSPAILLRSGIGPAEELRALGIAPLVDLPGVGANLGDHPALEMELDYRDPARSAPVLHTVATFRSATAAADGVPDLLLWLSDPVPDDEPWFGLDLVLLKPHARGRLRLRSRDPADPPIIELPGLATEDVARLADGYRRAQETFSRRPMDDEALRRHVRDNAYSLPHVVGTCAMGLDPATGAVVGASGQVHALDGLWVADASIMPSVPSAFTQLPTIMIAERIAEEIAATASR
jgi:choline dehydrogenase-like flavoprotein